MPLPLLPLARPDVSDLERRYVDAALHSLTLSGGPYRERFEALMAERTGTRHAVAVHSGTAALHLIVRSLTLPRGSEVLTTPFSFIASSNVLLYEGLTVRFADIDPETYNLDPSRAEAARTAATRAVLAVDLFGLPADWPALTALARQHDLALVADACESLGGAVGGRPVGAWGHAAAFGFYPNKQITTGEGGCITTDDAALAARCRSLRNQGRADDGRMEHAELGFSYRMGELPAAVGCAQLERLDALQAARTRVAAWYDDALAGLQEALHLPGAVPGRSWFVYVVRLHDAFADDARDALMAHLGAHGIGAAPYFPAIHLQPFYRRTFGFRPGDFPVTERVAARTLALPFFTQMTEADVDRVRRVLTAGLAGLPRATTTHAVSASS